MTDFHGRNILVTGGSGGIGGTTVRHLVKANANVIAAGRSQEALAAIAKETGCRTVTFDLASEDDERPVEPVFLEFLRPTEVELDRGHPFLHRRSRFRRDCWSPR